MSAYETIVKRRTIRKFKQDKIDSAVLEKMVDAARLAPSGSNVQSLKYMIVDIADEVGAVFEQVRWAAHIAPDGTPKEGERPVAFIVILVDTGIAKADELGAGAAAQNIMLTALDYGIGSCWMGAIHKPKIREILQIDERYQINTVIALGYQDEWPVTEDVDGSTKYYKDENGVLHVPKRTIQEVLVKTKVEESRSL